jgi:septum formation inhibitor MinC
MSASAAESLPAPAAAAAEAPPPSLADVAAASDSSGAPDESGAGEPAVSSETPPSRPAAVLKGGTRGLEFLVDGRAKIDAIAAALCTRLAEAPAFFRGSSVRVRVEDGPLPPGCLARLDDIAARFELRIVEVGAARALRSEPEAVALPALATGSMPVALAAAAAAPPSEAPGSSPAEEAPAGAAPLSPSPAAERAAPTVTAAAESAAAAAPSDAAALAAMPAAAAAVAALPEGDTRIVLGPVRSGVILEHHGNLVVVGDVNPGAEVRAERNIIVLGRLRGIAHAGIGRTFGFILALKLEPQQLRIARQVARASDADGPVAAAEIAYVTSNKIVVERYAGKLPLGLGNSL